MNEELFLLIALKNIVPSRRVLELLDEMLLRMVVMSDYGKAVEENRNYCRTTWSNPLEQAFEKIWSRIYQRKSAAGHRLINVFNICL